MRRILLTLLLCLLASRSFAAVAHDASSSTTGAGVSSIGTTHTTSGSNRLLVCTIFVATGGAAESTTGATYNGVALTNKATVSPDPQTYANTWFLIAPASGTNSWAFSLASSLNTDNIVAGCDSFTGVNQTTPLGTAQTTLDIVTGLSVTVPTNGLGYDVAYSAFGNAGCTTRTPGGSQTQGFQNCNNRGAAASLVSMSSYISSSGTMNWDHDSGNWEAQIAVPISEAVAPPPTARRRRVVFQ